VFAHRTVVCCPGENAQVSMQEERGWDSLIRPNNNCNDMGFTRMAQFHCLANKDFRTPYVWRGGLPVALLFATEVGLSQFSKVCNLLLPLVG
jgi:hypothetical protein